MLRILGGDIIKEFIKAPCHNCDKRKLGCHSCCEEYISFRNNRDKLLLNRKKENEINSYCIENIIRITKRT